MAPLACAVRRDDAGVSAWVVNGTDTVLTAQARWQLLAIDGEPIDDTATADVVLAANAVTPLTPPPAWFADRTRPLIGRLTLTDSTQTAHAHAWPEPFRWHRFPDPQVRVVLEPDSGCVLVSATRPAKGVWLDAPGTRFEDNFLDLLPGEVRRLRVHGSAIGSVNGTTASCLNTWQDAP
jgi:beta-mannosidase